MIGLVFQGGGVRGAYQAGAYYAMHKCRLKINGVCGTSIGAFNAAMVASGEYKNLLKFWQTADIGKILGFDEEYLAKKKAKEYDFDYIKLSFKNLFRIFKNRGIDTKGLEEVLNTYINPQKLKKSKMDYGLCTFRLSNFKPLYVFKEDMQDEKINEYILASCSLPIFKIEKKIDDKIYVDGGFYDNTPINMLIDKGYKKIYVVSLNPIININKKPKKETEIIRITPIRSLGQVLTLDRDAINEYIKMGYFDTLRVLKHLDGKNYCFKKHRQKYYEFISRKISKNEMRKLMGFFNTHTIKDTIIASLEYIMIRENIDYYKIYKPYKMIKLIKKYYHRKHFVYNFVRQLRFL